MVEEEWTDLGWFKIIESSGLVAGFTWTEKWGGEDSRMRPLFLARWRSCHSQMYVTQEERQIGEVE